ncbi:MAG: NAD(P)/FAD-dependent oxidoreductase [Caulobacterales bacterium]|uniref:NAD(P)/FAD-dependent oxidoreductase n=1 Tax=Glycocaulis sp. TaxID=1969725 RepID=UPI003FA0BD6A
MSEDGGPRGRTCTVIGGGIIGAACAFRLQAAGLDVTLVDPGDRERAAAFGNAGHIATEQVTPLASLPTLANVPSRLFATGGPVDFRLRDAGLWLPWSARLVRAALPDRFAGGTRALSALLSGAGDAWLELARDAGLPDRAVRMEGHGIIWFDPLRAARGQKAWQKAPLGTASIRPMESFELDQYETVLARRPAGGLRFSGTGQVRDPGGLLEDLLAAGTKAGVQTVAATVTSLQSDGSRALVHLAGGAVLETDLVLLAAGAGSAVVLRTLGLAVPLIGERGYSVRWEEHDWPAGLPLTVFEEHSVVAGAFDSGLRLAGMTEFGSAYAPPDPRKWQRLERHAGMLGLPVSGTGKRWSGPRPTLPDYLPAIGRIPDNGNILYAFGHQHLGLTLAAITADLVAELALVRASSVDLSPFSLRRFARA